MKVVEVRWLDAWIDTDDYSLADAKKLKPVVRTTVGQLVCYNKDGIVLCTDRYDDGKKDISTPMVIGWNMVDEYWEYEDADDDR